MNYTNESKFGALSFGDDKCGQEIIVVDVTNKNTFGYIMSCVEFLQAILSIAANLLTILAVAKNHRLRTIPNAFVFSLAISDMTSGILLFYEFLFRLPGLNEKLHENFFLCVSLFYFLSATFYESMLLIAIMSFERFVYICYPFKYEMLFSGKTVKGSIAFSWVVSFIVPLIPIIVSANEKFTGCVYGVLSGDYYCFGLGLSFYIALILCFCFHVNILRVAANHRKRIACLSVGESRTKPAKSIIGHHWKMIQTFLLVYTVSYVFWLPWVTCSILRIFYCISRELMDIFSMFGMASGTLNFLVYGLLNDDFRRTYRMLICGKCQSGNFDERSCTNLYSMDVPIKITSSKDTNDETFSTKKTIV